MPGLQSTTASLKSPETENPSDEAQLAAAAFRARYSGRTLDAIDSTFARSSSGLPIRLSRFSTRHDRISSSTARRSKSAASPLRRSTGGSQTVCGYYRFAHIDGRILSNPAQYVRRPKVYPSEGRGMDRGELGTFLFTAERFDRDHAVLAVLLGLNGLG